jgi:hypothetical protein
VPVEVLPPSAVLPEIASDTAIIVTLVRFRAAIVTTGMSRNVIIVLNIYPMTLPTGVLT